MRVLGLQGVGLKKEILSTITTSKGFTAATIVNEDKKAVAALIVCETAAIRFWLDGSTVTITGGANPGILMDPGQSYLILGERNVEDFRCINAVDANNAVLNCQFFF